MGMFRGVAGYIEGWVMSMERVLMGMERGVDGYGEG